MVKRQKRSHFGAPQPPTTSDYTQHDVNEVYSYILDSFGEKTIGPARDYVTYQR